MWVDINHARSIRSSQQKIQPLVNDSNNPMILNSTLGNSLSFFFKSKKGGQLDPEILYYNLWKY